MKHFLLDKRNRLIIDPFSQFTRHSPLFLVVLIIDVLDECDNENDIQAILGA